MTDTKGSEFLSIRGKRRSVSPTRLRSKYQAAPGDYGGGRALVRVGQGMTDVLIGRDDVSTWDNEELRRGRRRDKNGGWAGKDPIIVAKAVHDELVQRTLSEANKLLTENLTKALEILVNIMQDEDVDAKERLTAIRMITDRAMGKEPQRLEVDTGDKPWQVAISTAIVSIPEELIDQHADNREELGDLDPDGNEPD